MGHAATPARAPARKGEGLPPDLISGLRLTRRLARGGFAEVWEAEQESLGRQVAVKIMRGELLGLPEMVRLFEQESRVLARLNHPNVVQVIDRGTTDFGPYFVMEYVQGETLQSLIAKKALPREKALSILLQAARGLAYAHRSRVVHRDVKPANILVARDGQVKIGDFGIAAVRAATEDDAEDGDKKKSQALGTRAYMAPEQRTSFDGVEPPADVYSLGVILHRILAGRLPNPPGVVAHDADIPTALRPILNRALREDPSKRYPHAGEFREALVNALEGRHLDARVRLGAASTLGAGGRFELLDVIRQDRWRSVYLVRKGGEGGETIVVKRYVQNKRALATVRQLTRIEHPNIVRILAVGERDDAFIVLMEHLPGGDLRERLVQPHGWRKTARIGRDVAAALACAHDRGIVHGNLRPSNILFDEQGRIRVTDFGFPEHYRGDPSKKNWYAAPEEDRGPARDIYALGAVLFEMLFAVQPTAENARRLLADGRSPVPPRMRSVLSRMLADRDERIEGAEHVARELTAALEEDAERRRAERLAGPGHAPAGGAFAATSLVPGLAGLGGLVVAWLLDRPAVLEWLGALFARF